MPYLKKSVKKRREGGADTEWQDVLRDECKEPCSKYNEKLQSCNARVTSKSQTTETCMEELIDFMHCIDECIAKDLFSYLK